MSLARLILWGFILVVVLGLVNSMCFTVGETEQALVVTFGAPKRIVAGDVGGQDPVKVKEELLAYAKSSKSDVAVDVGAGIYFKRPFTDSVLMFEDRLLEYDAKPTDVVTQDKKHLHMDSFARWRIANVLLFYQSVRDERGAQARLDDIIYSALREELSKNTLVEILRTTPDGVQTEEGRSYETITVGREKIMERVSQIAREKAAQLGIGLADVRIKRADLPSENQNAVYGRMKAERDRISLRYQSEGREEASKIRAETDREVQVVLANAYREAQFKRGDADARAAQIYAQAVGSNVAFFEFQRSLEVLGQSLGPETRFILNTNSGLLKALHGGAAK
jgi:membrane protease subunit HflC